jgi:deoxyribonuclease-4
MLPNGRPLGAHLPLGSGMVRAADRAAAIGASALQVFSDNPTSWRRRPTLPRELPAFLDRLAAHGLAPLAIHAPYLVNLAGPEPDFHERSVSVLANELRVAAAYGARFVNVHVGSHRGAGVEAGIDRFADGIRQTFALLAADPAPDAPDAPDTPDAPDGGGPVLVLENSAGGGFGLGVTLEELERIDEAVTAAGIDPTRFGYCLDTAHAWGAGYAIDTRGGVDEMLAEFDRRLGLRRLLMIHLNDSRSELGSRADRHEHIGAGRIGAAGLGRLLVHPALDHVAYYLETPGMEAGFDEINIGRAKDLAAGRPLADLPSEAFETRARRGHSAPPEREDDPPVTAARRRRPAP